VRRLVLGRVHSWLLLGTSVGLFGCPLLLDDFTTGTLSAADAGQGCIGEGCAPPSHEVGGHSGAGGGASGSFGNAGSAGVTGTGGTTSGAGSGGAGSGGAGNGGAGGSAGDGGAGGVAGAGGSTGQGGAETACWTLELTSTYGSGSNCVGANGTSNVVADTGTTLALSHDGGDPCFSGTIASTGWGAVYELTFAAEPSVWNASGAGVTGFEFAYRGTEQPSSVRVLYKDPSGVDNCRVIGPGTTSVPFSVAHPGCNASGTTVDSARLVEMILAFTPKTQPYDVDFCMQIRALD
jgi:hypothetical protein